MAILTGGCGFVLTLVVTVFPDNHDLISMKLYQLTVERTLEEEQEEEVRVPSVDNMAQFKGAAQQRCNRPFRLVLESKSTRLISTRGPFVKAKVIPRSFR